MINICISKISKINYSLHSYVKPYAKWIERMYFYLGLIIYWICIYMTINQEKPTIINNIKNIITESSTYYLKSKKFWKYSKEISEYIYIYIGVTIMYYNYACTVVKILQNKITHFLFPKWFLFSFCYMVLAIKFATIPLLLIPTTIKLLNFVIKTHNKYTLMELLEIWSIPTKWIILIIFVIYLPGFFLYCLEPKKLIVLSKIILL